MYKSAASLESFWPAMDLLQYAVTQAMKIPVENTAPQMMSGGNFRGWRACLGVMGDEEGEAASGCDEVLQSGVRDGQPVMCRSASPQFVYDHQ